MSAITRKAQVAGKFYPSEKREIEDLMDLILEKEKPEIDYSLSKKKILGAVLPHAGHFYSGYQTIHFFEILKRSGQVFDRWVIIHPLHHGGDIAYAAEGSDFWSTPLGNVRVDKGFIEAMGIPVSKEIHRYEHSSEVILPFIQRYFGNDFSFVSVGMARQNCNSANEISNAIIKASEQCSKKTILIASSDFSHYVSPEAGRKLDQKVLDCILKKDYMNIYKEVTDNDLSVCGFGPIMVLCNTLEQLYPGSESVILARGHSGEVHLSASVVDYISILFHK
jgi:AmmeMemoRadiSam system protein B